MSGQHANPVTASRERSPLWVYDNHVHALVEQVSDLRLRKAKSALDALRLDGKHQLSNPAWGELAAALGSDIFDDLQINRSDLQRIVRLMHVADEAQLRSPGSVFQVLRTNSMEKIANLQEALNLAGLSIGDDQGFVREFLFQLYVIALNSRLQMLYRTYLDFHPFDEVACEDERVVHLVPMEPWAYRLVAASEPCRVLQWLGISSVDGGLERLAMALNKFHFDPYRVNFRFTHHCNIQCAHCYNFSGPKMKSERIATENMLRIVRDMPAAGMTNMNLTGGEPFMYLDTVLTLIDEARRASVETVTIYTNGFFAKTKDGCRKVLERLKRAGFMNELGRTGDHIKVSAGVFHQEFLPFETIINLIRVYREVFGKDLVVDYEILENRADVQAEIERELHAKGVADLVEIHFRRISPIGRGAQFDPTLNHLPVEQFRNCLMIDEIVFDPDGSVLPCCGMNFGNRGIVVGNINNDGLLSIFRRLENNPILQYIANNQISDIFEHRGKAPAALGYADLCSLCHHALGDLEDSQDLKRELSQQQDYFPVWFEVGKFASS